jgi:hypothetical protein
MRPEQFLAPWTAAFAKNPLSIRHRVIRSSGLGLCLALVGCVSPGLQVNIPKDYKGKPFHDTVYSGGAQKIPGMVYCAYYDMGGEGVAYHDSTPQNLGSGALNPANGEYLNEFRMKESVDTSYVKFHDEIDNNPYDRVQPPDKMLYVGWTEPGEWFNLTVEVQEAGTYDVDLLYTSHQGGTISMDLNGRSLCGPLEIVSTYDNAEPAAWRQWHHWNMLKDAAEVKLPKGLSVLTVHILTEGNMNLGRLDFRRKR